MDGSQQTKQTSSLPTAADFYFIINCLIAGENFQNF